LGDVPLPPARPADLGSSSSDSSSSSDDNKYVREPKTFGDIMDIIAGYAHRAQSEFYGSRAMHPGSPEDTLAEIMGSTLSKLKLGNRLPMNKAARNPMMEEITAMAMKYFGQGPTHRVAMDDVFPKIIGVFTAEQGGSGSASFNFSNLPSFNQTMQLVDVVANVVTGGGMISSGSSMIPSILNMANKVATIAGSGVDLHTLVDMSRPDHMIPLMNAMSHAFGGEDELGMFDEDMFAEGYRLAGDVQSHLASLVGGDANYSRILDVVASGDIDRAVDALGYLANQAPTVTRLINQVQNIRYSYEAPNIQQALSSLQIPSPQQMAQVANTLSQVQDLHPLEGVTTIVHDVIPQIGNVTNVLNRISTATSIGQLQNAAAGLQNVAGALSQLQNLSGTIANVANFGSLTAKLDGLANLPKALDNAINKLNMSPEDMAQSLLSGKANEMKQILGHIVKEAGKF
jgi:hypothetical protein